MQKFAVPVVHPGCNDLTPEVKVLMANNELDAAEKCRMDIGLTQANKDYIIGKPIPFDGVSLDKPTLDAIKIATDLFRKVEKIEPGELSCKEKLIRHALLNECHDARVMAEYQNDGDGIDRESLILTVQDYASLYPDVTGYTVDEVNEFIKRFSI